MTDGFYNLRGLRMRAAMRPRIGAVGDEDARPAVADRANLAGSGRSQPLLPGRHYLDSSLGDTRAQELVRVGWRQVKDDGRSGGDHARQLIRVDAARDELYHALIRQRLGCLSKVEERKGEKEKENSRGFHSHTGRTSVAAHILQQLTRQ